MQNIMTSRGFSSNPVISFCGIVFAILREYDQEGKIEPCVLICSSSRNGRIYRPLLLKLGITDSSAHKFDGLKCGEIVSGEFVYKDHTN